MDDDKTPVQADGGAPAAPAGGDRQGHDPAGGGESGGGAYRHPDVTDGDNAAAPRPVKTGREPHR